MIPTLPTQATKYLVESLDKRTTCSPNKELRDSLVEYYGGGWGYPGSTEEIVKGANQMPQYVKGESPKEIAQKKKKEREQMVRATSGGFGAGGPAGKANDKGPTNILFGDTEEDDWGAGAAAAAYGIGKGLETFADVTDALGANAIADKVGLQNLLPSGGGFWGNVGGALVSKSILGVPKLASKLARQLADLSGASWFDANAGRIAQNQLELAAQGGGRFPGVVPGPKKTKTEPWNPNRDREAAIKAAEEQERIGNLRSKGYVIP
jgi:hypothetical protein